MWMKRQLFQQGRESHVSAGINNLPEINGQIFVGSIAYRANCYDRNSLTGSRCQDVRRFHFHDTA